MVMVRVRVRRHKWRFARDVLEPFIFIFVMDYIAKHAEGNTEYLTHIDLPARDNSKTTVCTKAKILQRRKEKNGS